jgi:hypothetical protein
MIVRSLLKPNVPVGVGSCDMVRARVAAAVLSAAYAGAAVACSSSSNGGPGGGPGDGGGGLDGGTEAGSACTQTPIPDGGPFQVTGTVVTVLEDGGLAPVPNAMVAVEYGGLYLPWCDLSKASPYYLFGAVTDDAGAFALTAGAGKLGFHGFATGQYYSRAALDTSTGATTVRVALTALPPQQTKPTITGAAFDAPSVAAGAQVTITATVKAGTPTDPLSDETVLVEPTRSWALELDPPALGAKDDFPDGTWSRTFAAPAQPGSYVYWLSATTAGCVTSDLVTLPLQVQ